MTTTHLHTYDLHPRDAGYVYCTECGFSVKADWLKSRSSLDAIVARKRATQAVLDMLKINRDGIALGQ